jgi:hypothetical protein
VYLSPVLKFFLLLHTIETSFFDHKKAKSEATGAHKEEKPCLLLSEVLDIYKELRRELVIDRQFPLKKSDRSPPVY